MEPQPLHTPRADAQQINRVVLACTQCRDRHVKCGSEQPVCTRCRRDGKDCTYIKSRRGGLDKAALARRRLKLQQQAECERRAGNSIENQSSNDSSNSGEHEDYNLMTDLNALNFIGSSLAFTVDPDRLVGLFYETFWPTLPVTLPLQYFRQRTLTHRHDLELLLLVVQFVGSIYAPWTPSDPYYQIALQAVSQTNLPKTGFTVQALLIFAVAEIHLDRKCETRKPLDDAVSLGLELQINKKEFAYQHGEGDPVLEESWRRTYYLLHVTEQHAAVVANSPFFALRDVPNLVDLPCDDEYYQSGQIPLPVSWEEYEVREFAEVEVIYSSIVYLYDAAQVVTYVMKTFLATGTFSDHLISTIDAKVAAWRSLLPASKKDPLRPDGTVDEIMFLAHLVGAIVIMNIHRPFSALTYSAEELSARSFTSHIPLIGPQRQSRSAHTARALKAAELQTKLLAIPCQAEKHPLFTACIAAAIAVAEISACNVLLDGHALSIARDRIRLTIGFLRQMGTVWPLARHMADEVKYVARSTLVSASVTHGHEPDPAAVIELPRDELIYPVHPYSQIDIYSGIVLPPWEDASDQTFLSTPSTMS